MAFNKKFCKTGVSKSPFRDIDTRFVDKIYNKQKVDEDLIKKGYHTEGNLRGKKNTSDKGANSSVNNAMTDNFI
tara:strand:+ start:684 stop:905 length:222 start_codon:yes stop_codon:yes gene_type:complete